MNTPEFWRKCSSCKSPIAFGKIYHVCSVSTCNRQRTGLVFCKVSCFDAHVPMMNHKDAGAFEKRAPSLAEWQREQAAQEAKAQAAPKPPAAPLQPTGDVKNEILVIASKTKDYIRSKGGCNTSDAVMAVLSDKIRELLDEAIKSAESNGRKTVLDRDVH